MARYDATVKVNVTIEYPYGGDSVKQGAVKDDLRTVFEGLDIDNMPGVRVWVTEVDSTGRPTYIDG